jgi:hypothetical protein
VRGLEHGSSGTEEVRALLRRRDKALSELHGLLSVPFILGRGREDEVLFLLVTTAYNVLFELVIVGLY